MNQITIMYTCIFFFQNVAIWAVDILLAYFFGTFMYIKLIMALNGTLMSKVLTQLVGLSLAAPHSLPTRWFQPVLCV